MHAGLLGIEELSRAEIESILARAKDFQPLQSQSLKKLDTLRGKMIVNLFFEASTRTRTSFEIAAKRMGADAVSITASGSSVSKGESLVDQGDGTYATTTGEGAYVVADPNGKVCGVYNPDGTVRNNCEVDEFITLDPHGPRNRRGWAVARRMRRERHDWAVLFPNSFRSALVAWLGGCQRRIGYARYARSFLLTDALPVAFGPDGRPLVSPILDAYNALAEAAGCPSPRHRDRPPDSNDSTKVCRRFQSR